MSSSCNVDRIMQKYSDMTSWEWSEHKGNAEFVAFRKELVDALLKCVIETIGCPTCNAVSVGSTSLTSDYDITVSGPLSADIVREFNREFRLLFKGKESATVFDTNVYGAGFLEPIHLGNFSVYGKFKYVADAGDAQQQREWALLKMYLHMTDREREPLEWIQKKIDLSVPRDDISAMNRAYEKALRKVKLLKEMMMNKTEPNYVLRRRYKNAISQANYYGAETYFTQGAFMHVVGKLQSKLSGLPITEDEYMDSFIENLGDAIPYAKRKYRIINAGLTAKGGLEDALLKKKWKYLDRAIHTGLTTKDELGEATREDIIRVFYKRATF